MPFRKEVPCRQGLYYISFSCYRWLRLFQFTSGYDLVYQWFDQLKNQGHRIAGYLIMPNQVQFLVSFSPGTQNINTIVGEGKRSIAYSIVERLKARNEVILLTNLQNAVTDSDRRKGKKHEIWEESFDWKFCETLDYVYKKLQQMHSTPCIGSTRLVKEAPEYDHSSARYYATRKHASYHVVDAELLHQVRTGIDSPSLILQSTR